MNRRTTLSVILSSALLACLVVTAAPAVEAQGDPTPQQRAAKLKEWLKVSQANLHKYEWVETIIVSKGGEEKMREQQRCYYGVDGTLEKVQLNQTAAQLPSGPLRKKIAEHEKEELTGYMKQAVALMHSYIPPGQAAIQQVVDAGRLNMQVLEPGRRVRLDFAGYLKEGDVLGVEIDTQTNRLLGITVSSYLDSTEDPVKLNVAMSVLPDGTMYAQNITLDASAKDISITVDNGGYRLLAQ